MTALHRTVLRGGLAALALLAVTATAQPARAQCFWMEHWDGVRGCAGPTRFFRN